jgi:hypothetical protein
MLFVAIDDHARFAFTQMHPDEKNADSGHPARMVQRWVASALNDAAPRMRRLRGCDQMKTLLQALAQRAPKHTVETSRQAA